MTTWQRWASIALGAAFVARALRSQRVRPGLALTGLGFVSRGLSGFCPVTATLEARRPVRASIGPVDRTTARSALAGSRGIRLAEGIRIRRPPHEVYDFWRNLGNMPRFMSHIERVETINSTRSHWVARGPAGLTVEWDAEVINERRPDLIGWQSVGNADVASAGSVRFSEMADGATQVDLVLQYELPAGRIGARIAAILGLSPDAMLREDLRHLKVLLESEGRRRLSERWQRELMLGAD